MNFWAKEPAYFLFLFLAMKKKKHKNISLASFCLSKKKRKKDTFSSGVSHSLALMGTARTG